MNNITISDELLDEINAARIVYGERAIVSVQKTSKVY